MGFILGTSISISPSSSSPAPCSRRRRLWRKKMRSSEAVAVAVASSLRAERPQEEACAPWSAQRRCLLFLGVSFLPLLRLRALAAQDPDAASAIASQTSGLTTIFLSPRQREKDLPPKSVEPPQDLASEEEIYTGKREDQVPKIVNSQDEAMVKQDEQKLEVIMTEKENISNQEGQEREQAKQEISPLQPNESKVPHGAPGNPISLLNALGILASGVLGALYATSQKDIASMQSTIESMKIKLSENDAAVASLKDNFERKLLKVQEEHKKQVRKFEEEAASLTSQISSAKETIVALGREMQSEKKFVEELKSQICLLESTILRVEDDRNQLEAKLKEKINTIDLLQDRSNLLTLEINDKEKKIENLQVLLGEKESELKNLSFVIDQTRTDLSEANSIMQQLKEELLKTNEEVQSKEASIGRLHAEIESLSVEKDEYSRKFHDLTEEYDALKTSSEQSRVHDSELLSKKDSQIHQLEEKLGVALGKVGNNQTLISELRRERDDLQVLLEREVNSVKQLKHKLQAAEEALEESKLEASNLRTELMDTKGSYEELMSKTSKLQDELQKTNTVLSNNLEEAKCTSETLSHELVSIREVLESTEEKLSVQSNELKTVANERESLKRELLDIYSKLEMTVQELKEERNVVSTLNRELEVLAKQMLKDSEARRALEADLDAATKSLDEMNQSALLLSSELENTNARAASLETEKEMLFQSILDQQNIAKEAQENIEDAQHLITRLGNERESLEKRTKKLEEELASAKGEILRLRRQISMSKESTDGQAPKPKGVSAGTPFTTKNTARKRRKGSSSSGAS